MAAAAKTLDVTEDLSRAVESGDVEEVERLLPRVGNINARNRHGTTVLMTAARGGHAQIVRVLLDHGADPNLTRNDKFTALALAAFFGHTEAVKTLMEFGARTESVTRCGASAQTWATARTFAEVARCLNTPAPETTQLKPRIQLQRNVSRSRFFTLGIIATFIVIACCGLGALVLRSSERHKPPPAPSLQPAPIPPPPKVEARIIEPVPQPPAPKPVVNETPVATRTAGLIRPTIKKTRAPRHEEKSVSVLTEQPAEEVKTSEPPVVAKPKPRFDSLRPVPLSPEIMAPTRKAKVIQWP